MCGLIHYWVRHSKLQNHLSYDHLTAFLINVVPYHWGVTIGEAADVFELPDFHRVLGDQFILQQPYAAHCGQRKNTLDSFSSHMSRYGIISRYSSACHKISIFSSHPAPFRHFIPQQTCLIEAATWSLSVTQTAAESIHLYLVLTVSFNSSLIICD